MAMLALPTAPRQRGFTLIELVVSVALLGILLALAGPSFKSLLEAQRMRSAAFDLMADITLARNEALKRGDSGVSVSVTRNSAGWSAGWQVLAGTEVLSTRQNAGSGVSINNASTAVTFDRNGRVSSSSSVVKFAIQDSSASRNRCISIDPSGRPKSATTACP